ncbi:MAG TPA: DUF1902 domain-containing protein [Caulobacter sp.]|nr:DUF1902 domain-containing protein [Caulobacter sp.]
MSNRYHVQADWDPEANVWVSSSNIPGLVIEAATLPEFVELAQALAPELLSDNLGIHGPIPVDFRATETLELHK